MEPEKTIRESTSYVWNNIVTILNSITLLGKINIYISAGSPTYCWLLVSPSMFVLSGIRNVRLIIVWNIMVDFISDSLLIMLHFRYLTYQTPSNSIINTASYERRLRLLSHHTTYTVHTHTPTNTASPTTPQPDIASLVNVARTPILTNPPTATTNPHVSGKPHPHPTSRAISHTADEALVTISDTRKERESFGRSKDRDFWIGFFGHLRPVIITRVRYRSVHDWLSRNLPVWGNLVSRIWIALALGFWLRGWDLRGRVCKRVRICGSF